MRVIIKTDITISTEDSTTQKGTVQVITQENAIENHKKHLLEVGVIILIAAVLLIIKGSSDGQRGFFGYLVSDYIEETSHSLVSLAKSPSEMADINSLSAVSGQTSGQGGPDIEIDPTFIQENAISSYNPSTEDYVQKLGYSSSNITEYTVQEGDLLSFIASDYGVSVNSIMWSNSLKSADSISLGQVLRIPPVSGVAYTVKKGDTISSIAKKYAVKEESIVDFNSLSIGGVLSIGDDIVIPDGRPTSSNGDMTPTLPSAGAKRFTYLPDFGDYFMSPSSGFNWGRIHGRNGVDIANKCGTPIYAAADGVVTTSDGEGWNGGYGKFLKIVHGNGTETLYAHAKQLSVASGQNVAKGQQIALMGTTGRSTGCHLHFEVHGAKNLLAKY